MQIQVEVDEMSAQKIEEAVVKHFIKQLNIEEIKKGVVKEICKQVVTDQSVKGAINAGVGQAKETIKQVVEQRILTLSAKEFTVKLKDS